MSASRCQAMAAFINSCKLTEAETVELTRKWASGLDKEDTLAGNDFRTQVIGSSDVVINFALPPAPPAPPPNVPISLVKPDAITTSDVLKHRATALEVDPLNTQAVARATELRRIAGIIDTAIAGVPA